MKMSWMRAVAAATLITLGASSVGCGYILYPERRGNRGGAIDGGTLVMDILWLIPGIIPGVVFLIVDFSSGAMYVNGRHALRASPTTGNVALKLEDSSQQMTLQLQLVTESKRVLDSKVVGVGPGIKDQTIELSAGGPLPATHEKIYLQILDANHSARPLQAPIEVL
jgi:hypothetical protein